MDARDVAREKIEQSRKQLVDLSHRIHAHPELGFEEEKACGWLCETLDGAGFKVERGICELPTAFSARAGAGPLHVTICAEYDCLPGIGHACGHNIIAAMAVSAGIALAKVANDIGLTVTVIGTPAEEVGNGPGKLLLLERGAFEGTHFAMMVHPAPVDMAPPQMIALAQFEVRYTDKEAHASAFPSGDRNQLVARGEPSAGVHGLLRDPAGRSGALRWIGGDGVDGDRRRVGCQAARAADEGAAETISGPDRLAGGNRSDRT